MSISPQGKHRTPRRARARRYESIANIGLAVALATCVIGASAGSAVQDGADQAPSTAELSLADDLSTPGLQAEAAPESNPDSDSDWYVDPLQAGSSWWWWWWRHRRPPILPTTSSTQSPPEQSSMPSDTSESSTVESTSTE